MVAHTSISDRETPNIQHQPIIADDIRMADVPARADWEATLDDFVDLYVRQLRQTPGFRRKYLQSMIICCAVAGMLFAVSLDVVWQTQVSLEVLVGAVVGGSVGTLCLPFYGRYLKRTARRIVVAQCGDRLPLRCEMEVRPTCLWVRQDNTEMLLDWNAVRIVEDTPGGIELWSHWGAIVARDRGFATPAERERFLADARAFLPSRAGGLLA
jgi:hypothetical protein